MYVIIMQVDIILCKKNVIILDSWHISYLYNIKKLQTNNVEEDENGARKINKKKSATRNEGEWMELTVFVEFVISPRCRQIFFLSNPHHPNLYKNNYKFRVSINLTILI